MRESTRPSVCMVVVRQGWGNTFPWNPSCVGFLANFLLGRGEHLSTLRLVNQENCDNTETRDAVGSAHVTKFSVCSMRTADEERNIQTFCHLT